MQKNSFYFPEGRFTIEVLPHTVGARIVISVRVDGDDDCLGITLTRPDAAELGRYLIQLAEEENA